jgi:hypothetical protein
MAWQLPLLSAAIRLKTSDGGSMVRSRFKKPVRLAILSDFQYRNAKVGVLRR